jgi:hypothetical protein
VIVDNEAAWLGLAVLGIGRFGLGWLTMERPGEKSRRIRPFLGGYLQTYG